MPNASPTSTALTTAAASAGPHAHDGWAEVRAHDHVMRYRRSGAGRAVLVLAPAASMEPLWPELGGALSARFRVLVPDVPPPAAGDDVAAWLGDFLEGLGIAGVALVAAEPFCLPALELVLLDAERVGRLVLVPGGGGCGGPAGEAGLDGALATAAGGGVAVPLLVVRRGMAAAEALPLVTRFLGAGDAGRAGAAG